MVTVTTTSRDCEADDLRRRKITVFHLRCSNYAGGPETTLLGWLKFANREHFDPRIVFFEERYGLHLRSLEIFADHKVPVEIIPWGYTRNLPGALRALVAKVGTAPLSILHAHDVRSDFVSLIVGQITGAPVVVSNHAWHAVGFKRHLFEALRGYWLRFADVVVSVSADTRNETVRRGVPAERARTIYSGLDLSPYRNPMPRTEARARLGLASDDLVVGNVARMWPEKALHTLIEAAARLSPKYPGLRVVLTGDGLLEPALRAEVQRRGLEAHVRFLGFRKDLVEVMSAFDVFALPSLAEGTPMVIYSAMALGLPIAASAVNGVAEILEHERSALLIKPADTDELTTAIDRLLADPALRRGIGDAAKTRIEEHYSAEKAIKVFESLYETLIANHETAAGPGGVERI